MASPSFRFFFRGYHEPYATDRFLRNVFALEGLILGGDNDNANLRYKFADRGAFLLSTSDPGADDPEGYFRRPKDLYDARSSIVHSGKWGNDDIPDKLQSDAEFFSRRLLTYAIRNPGMEHAPNVDLKKRKLYRRGSKPSGPQTTTSGTASEVF